MTHEFPSWAVMWGLGGAIFAFCKVLAAIQARKVRAPAGRWLGFLFLWPGMDGHAFLKEKAPPPHGASWGAALAKTALGAALFWGVARLVEPPLVRGWIGLFGLIFLLHFGLFHLLALAWQKAGVNAVPIMNAPVLAGSLADFWGRRWNLAFRDLSHAFLFQPLKGRLGATGAGVAVFLVSGLIHDLVISLPAGGGYGLPTAYFLLQAIGVLAERALPRLKGRLFTVIVTAAPAFWLFHPPFVTRVILPFMETAWAI